MKIELSESELELIINWAVAVAGEWGLDESEQRIADRLNTLAKESRDAAQKP